MFILRYCGFCARSVETNATIGNQSEILDEPVIIEPFPDVTTLQLAHPSELPGKPAQPSAMVPLHASTNWEVFEEISPAKKVDVTPSFFPSDKLGNASDEQIDMHSALDKRISSREYILSITDDELSRFPIAFIESFYPDLSPGEIMQLEQRLCDLKTGFSCSERSSEPLSVKSENFLKSYRPQLTICTDAGFQVDNKRSNQSGFDIRQLILASQNRKIIPLDWKVIEQLQPFLSVIEFQNMAKKMGFHTLLQKQEPHLPLSDPANSRTASSDIYNALDLNRNTYPSTGESSFSANSSSCSKDIAKQNAREKLSPVIKIADTESENVEVHESNSSNEQTVKSLVDDLLLKL
ncbi:hypothetical protein ACH3XW_45830 [Acanthocheilonema viteae]|uniref:Uncharacterized protein n=1 Tax=Acanthocheilonema viteae TaxID=6277 RepID=A0A498S172_ACAVI|nr:unnamed protein product [Acanthocheilonema viteae]